MPLLYASYFNVASSNAKPNRLTFAPSVSRYFIGSRPYHAVVFTAVALRFKGFSPSGEFHPAPTSVGEFHARWNGR